MQSPNKTRIKVLFWEVKARVFYLILSFVLSFLVAYNNSTLLVYLFVSSYSVKKELNSDTGIFCEDKLTPNTFGERVTACFLNRESLQDFVSQFTLKLRKTGNIASNSNYETESTLVNGLLDQRVYLNIKDAHFDATRQYENSELLFELKNLLENKDLTLLNQFEIDQFSKVFQLINIVKSQSVEFIFTDISEAFSTFLLVAFCFSLLCIVPSFIYLSVVFFRPALHASESKSTTRQILFAFIVWLFVLSFIEIKVVPELASFFLQFQVSKQGFLLSAQTKIYSYCSWVCTILLFANAFLFAFLSILVWILNREPQNKFIQSKNKVKKQADPLNLTTQSNNRYRLILIALSAFLAPPDIFIQTALSIFFVVVFEVIRYLFLVLKQITLFRLIKTKRGT